MAQEFVIKSTVLEDKINQLLPSQGGAQAGVDLSASTMVVPVVNLTEAAEGSTLRQDLQTAFSHSTITEFNVANTTTTVINTTGYWRVFGIAQAYQSTVTNAQIQINDGTTTKYIFRVRNNASGSAYDNTYQYDFIVKLIAGETLEMTTTANHVILVGSVRQIADINGNLTNP